MTWTWAVVNSVFPLVDLLGNKKSLSVLLLSFMCLHWLDRVQCESGDNTGETLSVNKYEQMWFFLLTKHVLYSPKCGCFARAKYIKSVAYAFSLRLRRSLRLDVFVCEFDYSLHSSFRPGRHVLARAFSRSVLCHVVFFSLNHVQMDICGVTFKDTQFQ